MNETTSGRESALAAGLFGLLVFLPVFFLSGTVAAREISRYYSLAWSLFTAGIGFAIFRTGRVSFYRRLFFCASALAFLVHFKFSLFSKMFEASCFREAPFCHIAMAPYFLNYLSQQYLALVSGDWRLWGPLTLGAAWLFVTLAIGRGWCSWACFYGGIDDGLSALPRRALIKPGKWSFALRHLPAVLLVFLLGASFAYLLPVFCLWLCPFKLSGAFLAAEAGVRRAQYALMAAAIAALVLGPLLTKRRIFCSYLCPFAAWQAFWGRLNPFRITVDHSRCGGCLACVPACPMTAIKCEPGGKAAVSAYCNLCGECLDKCPGGGFRYTVLGADLPVPAALARRLNARVLFVYSALTLGGVFASLWAPAALRDIFKLAAG
ncbi:MAG: 4Fe-4S binding protein [Elusimicrobiales bacterium]|nr:4Fe-4S binding protein [Elusimicrobiales bacterium]